MTNGQENVNIEYFGWGGNIVMNGQGNAIFFGWGGNIVTNGQAKMW